MATSSTNSSTRTWQWWVNVIAFISLVIIGVALLLGELFGSGDIQSFLWTLANALAYIVVASCAFIYASSKLKRKNGIWYMLIWVGAVILVIIGIILPLLSK